MTDGGVFGWKGKWEGTERRKGGSVIGIYYIRQKPIFTKKKVTKLKENLIPILYKPKDAIVCGLKGKHLFHI